MINIIGNRIGAKRSGGAANQAFEFTVDTTLGDGLPEFTIRTKPGPNYDIKTSDGQTITGVTAQQTTITFPSTGVYTVKLTNYIPGFELGNTAATNAAKLTEISNWGDFCVGYSGSLYFAFYRCSSLEITATDIPDFSGINSFQQTFLNCKLSSGIPNIQQWDMSSVTSTNQMFRNTQLTSIDLSGWNLPALTNMSFMFEDCDEILSIDLSDWNAPLLTNMSYAFQSSLLLQTIDLTNFYAPLLSDLTYTFFNIPSLSSITNINYLDVSNVTSMSSTFRSTPLNQPLNFWDTSSVITFANMFTGAASFNYPIGMWDTSSATTMTDMFAYANSFNQDISNWDITNVTSFGSSFMLNNSVLDITNYDELLVGWEATLQAAYPGGVGYTPTISLNMHTRNYSLGGDAEAARTSLINNFGWTITDGGAVSNPFVFVVKTNNAGVSAADQFAFPLDASSTVNATVDWGDGNINTITAYNDPNATHTYAAAGTYTISVTGVLNGWRFNNGGDRQKLLDITQWGIFDINLSGAFYGCDNLTGSWTDHPRIGNTMQQTFANCFSFTGDVSEFSTVGVTSLSGVCQLHYSQSIPNASNWDVSNVTIFSQTFRETNTAGVDLSSWDVRNGISMLRMFSTNFGTIPDLSMWKVAANITNRNQIFSCANMFGTRSYNYGFESWQVGNCNFDASNLMIGANTMPQERYDSTLIAWSNNIGLGPQSFSSWNFGASNYTLGGAAEAARNNLINNYNFTFVDGGGI